MKGTLIDTKHHDYLYFVPDLFDHGPRFERYIDSLKQKFHEVYPNPELKPDFSIVKGEFLPGGAIITVDPKETVKAIQREARKEGAASMAAFACISLLDAVGPDSVDILMQEWEAQNRGK